jgi:hypothetical protein
VIEERIEVTGIQGRKRKQLLDDIKKKRRYCKFKGEALDLSLWRLALEEAMELSKTLRNEYN